MFTRAIARPPASNFSEGLTTVNLGGPDYGRALEQHEAYCAALEQCGLKLTKLAPDPNYPDSTFVEDVAVLIGALPNSRATVPASDSSAILARPGAPSRAGEVESMRGVLADFFPSLHRIESPGTLDGGDVCEAGDHFFIGISERTNEDGAQQLAQLLGSFNYTSSFVDIRNVEGVLHLKSGLAYLGDRRLAVIGALAQRAEFHEYDLISVHTDEEYAANCVKVNNRVLLARGYPKFERKLKDLGYQTALLDLTEFQKMDGGLSCLSLRF
jgi:dimethylargininase